MSGFFRNSPSKKPNVLTFPPPDMGMLRRSRCVLIFPKFRCIIFFDVRVPDYSNMILEKGKIKLNYVPPRRSAHLPNQRPVYFFTTVPGDGISRPGSSEVTS